MNYFEQIIPAPAGLRLVYLDEHEDEITSLRVLALALTETSALVPIVLQDGSLTAPRTTDLMPYWKLSLQ